MNITYYTDDGDEIVATPPTTMEVCWKCEGHGTHLRDAIREHAYSREEFEEAFFEDEDREAYFKRGGKYDITCTVCNGLRVVEEINSEAFKLQNPTAWAAWVKAEEEEIRYQAECAAERRMGC